MGVVRAMTDRERQLFEIFKKAVRAEQEAQAMYKQAIGLCDDELLKNILVSFHEDELRHEKEVMSRYQQFRSDFAQE
jgi:rubrerythrin